MTDLAPNIIRDPRHDPVLRDEIVAALAIAPGECHVDATFGAGGYTRGLRSCGAGRIEWYERRASLVACRQQ